MNKLKEKPKKIKWTHAIDQLKDQGFTTEATYFGLGKLLDGELELEQIDNEERVISPAELSQAKEWAEEYV